jgi:hypothetical protein
MVTRENIMLEITNFVTNKVNALSDKSIMFDILVKPFITEIVDVNLVKLDGLLKLVTDDKGLINTDRLLNNILDNLIVAPVKNIRGIYVGDGKVQIDIPLMNGSIIFDKSDFEELKANIDKHLQK